MFKVAHSCRRAEMGASDRMRVPLVALLLVLAVAVSGCPLLIAGAAGGGAGAVASVKEGQEEHHSPVTYMGTVLLDVFYVPAKVLFAGVGVVTSSLAYVVTVGDSSAFKSIWDSSVRGDYVLTPRMIEGKDPVHFVGPESKNSE